MLMTAVAAIGLTGIAAAVAPAASAAPSPAPAAGLSFTPASGLNTTPMYVLTPKSCPAGATNVLVMAFGQGFPTSGQPVVNNSTSGISHDAPFILPLQDTFEGFAAVNGTTLRGPYRVTLSCINRLGIKTYASFTGTVTFADATHYTAPAPTRAVVAAIAASQVPASDEAAQPTAGTNASSSPQASAKAGSSAQATAQPSAAGTGEAAQSPGSTTKSSASTTSPSKKSSDTWQPILFVAALLLIVGAVLMRVREVRRQRRREEEATERAADSRELAGSAGKAAPSAEPRA
jgi:hypothetical protein